MKRRPPIGKSGPAASRRKAWRRQGAPWSRAELNLLGKRPDPVLARRMQRTIKEVVAMRESAKAKRLELGLASLLRPGCRRWTPSDDALPGTALERDTTGNSAHFVLSPHIRDGLE